MTITLLVTDANLVPVGDPVSGWTEVIATPAFNTVGSGQVTMPATPPVLDQINADGARMVVIRDGAYFLGGPIEKPGPFDWSLDQGSDAADPGVVTVSFADDLALLAARRTYPDPAHASTAQTADYYTASAVNAETLLRALVNLNAGPGALAARRVPQLILGTAAGVGTNVNLTTRFEPLADVLRTVALAGGNLGFRTVQVGDNIVFTVYDPTDLAAQIRFSRGLGNLRAIHYDPETPTVTAAIVGGDGTGTGRTIRERVDLSTTVRLEEFVNRADTTDTTEMDQAGDEALAQGGERAQLSVVAIDTAVQRYGRDYALGDIVTVEIYPGLAITDVVRAVALTATPEAGEVVNPLIGADSTTTVSRMFAQYRQLERRLGRLERG
jgi:hypothetical protein